MIVHDIYMVFGGGAPHAGFVETASPWSETDLLNVAMDPPGDVGNAMVTALGSDLTNGLLGLAWNSSNSAHTGNDNDPDSLEVDWDGTSVFGVTLHTVGGAARRMYDLERPVDADLKARLITAIGQANYDGLVAIDPLPEDDD